MKVNVYLAVPRCRASIGLNVGRQIICWRGATEKSSAPNARMSTSVMAALVCRGAFARNAKIVGLISGEIVGIFREAMFFMNPESANNARIAESKNFSQVVVS